MERKVNEEVRQRFEEKGWVVIRECLPTEEVEWIRGEYRAMLPLFNRPTDDPEAMDWIQQDAVAFCLWHDHDSIARFAQSPYLAQIAAELLGKERLRLGHDEMLFKAPGDDEISWHQDAAMVPVDGSQLIAIFIPLIPIREADGFPVFVDGSHRGTLLGLETGLLKPRREDLARIIADEGWEVSSTGPLELGDVIFLHGNTLHGSHPNRTHKFREGCGLFFIADGARVEEPLADSQVIGLSQCLRGLKPGDLVAGRHHPVVYDASVQRAANS